MFNNNSRIFRFQYSKSDSNIIIFDYTSINKVISNSQYGDLLFQDFFPAINNINQKYLEKFSDISQFQLNFTEDNSLAIHSIDNKFKDLKKEIIGFFVQNFNSELNSINSRLKKPKTSIFKLKLLTSKENMNILPIEVQQNNLIHSMPKCNQVSENHKQSVNNHFSVSNRSLLNKELFSEAFSNFLLKVTKKKSTINIETFLDNVKTKVPPSDLLLIRKSAASRESDSEHEKSSTIVTNPEMMTVKLEDCNVHSDSFSNVDVESSFSSVNKLPNCDRESQMSRLRSNKRYALQNSYSCLLKLDSELNRKFLDDVKEEESIGFYVNQNRINMPFCLDINSPKLSKYKRKKSQNSSTSIPNKRPARSTAGQLPARLKSSSPISTFSNSNLQFSTLSLLNKQQIPIQVKNKGKRKSKSNDSFRTSLKINKETKPGSLNCDTILLSVQKKLSQQFQKYSSDTLSTDESVLNASPDTNFFNSKSPSSLSPGSDKLSLINSPSSRNGSNNHRLSKFKNALYENQTPNSPQWSFSSEFTSQSSVESVLSQKNLKFDQDEIIGIDNLLEDMDCEEMPPPRRTLTVAAMREKMRAKKMAKEEKKKCNDKYSLLEIDTLSRNKIIDFTMKQSRVSNMSTMMSISNLEMSEKPDDENMTNEEFDSFLMNENEIDNYHVEIDDKILNYSDDLDDLLLTGGNDSLLEIILKDADAVEIANDKFSSINPDCQFVNSMSSRSDESKCLPSLKDCNIPNSNAFNCSASYIITTTSKNIEKPFISDSSFIKANNPILSQTLTSAIQNSKDISNINCSLSNAYLVDGNGLSEALKLIQSLNPGAKVATQQYYLVNSGPQFVLCQTPPTQACSTCPVNSKSPIKSVINTTYTHSNTSSSIVTPLIHNISTTTDSSNANNSNSNNNSNNNNNSITSNAIISNCNISTSSKSPVMSNQTSILSSTISVLPQFSTFHSKPQNLYALNTSFQNKIITPIANLGCKMSNNNIQYANTISSGGTHLLQHPSIFGNQKPLTTINSSNQVGIRVQLASDFRHSQPVNIFQSNQNLVIPTLMNQPLRFISSPPTSNISLITQPQPMPKLVLFCPNLNCSPTGSDVNNSIKSDPQQLIFVSPQNDQSNPISLSSNPTIQVLNGPNFLQQISPNFGTILGSTNTNNLIFMNPQTLSNPSFSLNYQPQSQIITANNLVIMSSKNLNSSTLNHQPSQELSNAITKSVTSVVDCSKYEEDNCINVKTQNSVSTINSSHSQNNYVEILSNSSSANSKVSFDEKSSQQLGWSTAENLAEPDQDKSINFSQFQIFSSDILTQTANPESDLCFSGQFPDNYKHLSVDIDSPISNSGFHSIKISKTFTGNSASANHTNDSSKATHSDYETPCDYSDNVPNSQMNIDDHSNNGNNPNNCDSS